MTPWSSKLGNTPSTRVPTTNRSRWEWSVYQTVLSRRRQKSNPHKSNVEQHAIISYFWNGVSVNKICTHKPYRGEITSKITRTSKPEKNQIRPLTISNRSKKGEFQSAEKMAGQQSHDRQRLRCRKIRTLSVENAAKGFFLFLLLLFWWYWPIQLKHVPFMKRT